VVECGGGIFSTFLPQPWLRGQFGRKTALDAGERRVIAERYANGETMRALATEYGVGEATVWRALHGA